MIAVLIIENNKFKLFVFNYLLMDYFYTEKFKQPIPREYKVHSHKYHPKGHLNHVQAHCTIHFPHNPYQKMVRLVF